MQARKSTRPSGEVERLALSEITRMVSEHQRKRDEITKQLAAHYQASRLAGAPGAIVIPEREKMVRARAVALMNGHAPDALKLPPEPATEEKLFVERDAIDLVIAELRKEEFPARVAAAAEWLEENGDKWRAIAREFILGAHRLEALEQRAAEMKRSVEQAATIPEELPISNFIGEQTIFVDVYWDGLPFKALTHAAIGAGIVTKAEIEKVRNVD